MAPEDGRIETVVSKTSGPASQRQKPHFGPVYISDFHPGMQDDFHLIPVWKSFRGKHISAPYHVNTYR